MVEIFLFKEIIFCLQKKDFLKINHFANGNNINIFSNSHNNLSFYSFGLNIVLIGVLLGFFLIFYGQANLSRGILSLSRDLCGLNGRHDKYLLISGVANAQPQDKGAPKHFPLWGTVVLQQSAALCLSCGNLYQNV